MYNNIGQHGTFQQWNITDIIYAQIIQDCGIWYAVPI